MIDNYRIVIDYKVFEKIENGKCKYIAFVNDSKRKSYVKGNKLTLAVEGLDKELKAEIVNLLYFANVKELIEMIGKENFGYTQGTTLDKIEDLYYVNNGSLKIEKFGLVAIEFSLEK